MPPEMVPVYSTAVEAVGWDATTGDLWVKWLRSRSGKVYSIYEGVSAKEADEAQTAASVNTYIRQEIAPNHAMRYSG